MRGPAALVRAGMKRVPVVPRVGDEPRQPADYACGDDDGDAAQALASRGDEPAERGQRDDRDLRARPDAAAECEPEQHEVAARDALGQPKDEEQDCEAEDELRPVEAVRACRLPDEIRRPEPEEERRVDGAPRVEHAEADTPYEEAGDPPEHADDGADRPRVQAEHADERRGEELLLRP